ncbi:MAG: hypothetical protein EA402_04235 [Planctomycetota bacterium]|nr:MAG: hypothetical protein EA402_04235 [Planctomycetota bacterium]
MMTTLARRWRRMVFAGAALLLTLGFGLWWHYALPLSLERVHRELAEQGIASRWQDVADRQLSAAEDLARADALYAAMESLKHSAAADTLLQWYPPEEVDRGALTAAYADLDHDAIARIRGELQAWQHSGIAPLQRWLAPSVEDVLLGITERRGWARLSEARARLALTPSERATAITDIALLLAVHEEPLIIAMLVDISIAAIALGAMAEHPDLWNVYGEEFLAIMEPWAQPSYWQEYMVQGMLNEMRIASALFDEQGSARKFTDWTSANGIQIRFSAAQALRDLGASIHFLRDDQRSLREFIQGAAEMDALIHGDKGWWRRQASYLSQELVVPLGRVVERWARVSLMYDVLRHEMGLGPWPEDPWAAAGEGLRRYPEQGPLQRIWSVGPNGIDNGGEWDSDDIIIHWPEPGGP